MINLPLDKIAHADLLALIENEVKESRTIEYKRTLTAYSESEKHDFLAAITSLANTDGGDLLFGIEAKKGLPVAISTIGNQSEDDLALRLESMCRDAIEPRLPSIHLRFIPTEVGKVLLIRVEKSWRAPHRVKIGAGGCRFYGRSSAGKFPMNVEELRTAFLHSEDIAARVSQTRFDRINAIFNRDTPIGLHFGCAMVLHVVPLSALTDRAQFDLSTYREELQRFHPIGRNQYQQSLVSLQGVTNFANLTEERTYAYTQIMRNGVVEAVQVLSGESEEKYIHSKVYERNLIQAVNRYLPILNDIGVESPYYLMLSFVAMSDYLFRVPQSNGIGFTSHVCKQRTHILQIPEFYVSEFNQPAHTILRPMFNMVWNAFGYFESLNYDDNGNWSG